MCIGIIRNNSLIDGRSRAESNPGHWARHALLHMAAECVNHSATKAGPELKAWLIEKFWSGLMALPPILMPTQWSLSSATNWLLRVNMLLPLCWLSVSVRISYLLWRQVAQLSLTNPCDTLHHGKVLKQSHDHKHAPFCGWYVIPLLELI